MFHDYPYTDFHEMNLDYILKLCRESLGIHLVVSGNNLQLVNDLNQVLSQVTISFAETAAKDTEGNNITAYLIDAARSGRAIVFTSGDGNETTVQLPTDALTDINGKDITSYIARVDVSGQKLRITDGAGNAYTFTVPFANAAGKAETDINEKAITSYVADLVVSGNNLVVKDGNGNTLRTITVSYADESGTADKARKDLDNNTFLSDYAKMIVVDSDGKRVGLEAHDGTRLSTITVPFATLATDATNAIESVLVNGNQLQFRTYGGTVTNITVPYALKATSDGSNNEIVSNYVADVVNDAQTGKITFLAKDGSTIAELIPTVDSAVHDSYDNLIADFVKTIAVSAGSDYVTVTHGTGDTDSLMIDYSNRSWKDTAGNIIKNVYVKSMSNEVDGNGDYVLIAYNGENSEIFRFVLNANSAKTDDLGNTISETYIADLTYDEANNKLIAEAGDGSTADEVQIYPFTRNVTNKAVKPSSDIDSMNFIGDDAKAGHGNSSLPMIDQNGNEFGGASERFNNKKQIETYNFPSIIDSTPGNTIIAGLPKPYLASRNGVSQYQAGEKPDLVIYNGSMRYTPLVVEWYNMWQDAQGNYTYGNPDAIQGLAYTPMILNREQAVPYKAFEKAVLTFKADSTTSFTAGETKTVVLLAPIGFIMDHLNMSTFSYDLDNIECGIKSNDFFMKKWAPHYDGNSRIDGIEVLIENISGSNVTITQDDLVDVTINSGMIPDSYNEQLQIIKDFGIYTDFDQIIDNTIRCSNAYKLGIAPYGNSLKVQLFENGVISNLSFDAVAVYRASNSYQAEIIMPGQSITSNGNNIFKVDAIDTFNGHTTSVSCTYESANDDINYFTDGDIIVFCTHGIGRSPATIVKK